MTKQAEDLSEQELRAIWEREQARRARQKARAAARRATMSEEDRAKQRERSADYRERKRAVLDRAALMFGEVVKAEPVPAKAAGKPKKA